MNALGWQQWELKFKGCYEVSKWQDTINNGKELGFYSTHNGKLLRGPSMGDSESDFSSATLEACADGVWGQHGGRDTNQTESPGREEGAEAEDGSGADGDKQSRYIISGVTGLRIPTQLYHLRQVTRTL